MAHSPMTSTTTRRPDLGPSSSRKKTLCHIPKVSDPFFTGITTDGPVNAPSRWAAALSSILSCCQPEPLRKSSEAFFRISSLRPASFSLIIMALVECMEKTMQIPFLIVLCPTSLDTLPVMSTSSICRVVSMQISSSLTFNVLTVVS